MHALSFTDVKSGALCHSISMLVINHDHSCSLYVSVCMYVCMIHLYVVTFSQWKSVL